MNTAVQTAVTNKELRKLPSMESNAKASKIVRVRVTDGDATDSSSSDKTEHRRVKRNFNEIRIDDCSAFNLTKQRNSNNNVCPTLSSTEVFEKGRGEDGQLRSETTRVEPGCGSGLTTMRNKLRWFTIESRFESKALKLLPTSLAELQTESKDNSPELTGNECNRKVPKQPSNLSYEYFLTDAGASFDYFDYDNSAPIFFEQIMLPESILKQDCSDISIKLDDDFGSCSWDVDNYY
ncbi:hypothetical protein F3Y22_tig00007475pilonHSYRG00007 [Hibiscus syriacus]|uniref:Uncharacterized protein n=1 Tax=Hibiscus syriacus TaxID=106335 RepID=A0A6A3CFF3_HIBSY|nr:hypothetical protein F3Y22_tig00007475pilonHSYRG00007 [Hibiscus syriacus]